MIPYFEIPSIPIYGKLQIHAFGVLVAIAILVGVRLQTARARQLQLDLTATSAPATWVVGFGFVISHVFDVVAYEPGKLLRDPTYLFTNFSISSFGGFLGAVVGLVLWHRRYGKPILPYADATIFGFVFAWVFGRLGCFTAHDHPGHHTTFFLGVHYPDGVRHDLGLDEALFAMALAACFAIAFRKRRRVGVYASAACLAYPPVRFFLDFLRATDTAVTDIRYFGLTPGQYAAIAMFLFGVWLTWRVYARPAEVVATDGAAPAATKPVSAKSAPGGSRKRRRKG